MNHIELLTPETREFIRLSLAEDIGTGDVTTSATVSEGTIASARIIAKEALVVAGMPFAQEAFRQCDETIAVEILHADGSPVKAGTVIARIHGPARPILAGERVALNILQSLCGTATLTARFVREVEGLNARILDTRKTIPLMRSMQKYAVRMGGGHNHRMGLYDAVLIKDNHIRAAGGITQAVHRGQDSGLSVEVECETLEQVTEALAAEANIIMLDNMSQGLMRQAVELIRSHGGSTKTEASGNVTLENVRAIARTGVDYISVGALTHSSPAADISLRFDEKS